jgi:general secretion pathway protein A
MASGFDRGGRPDTPPGILVPVPPDPRTSGLTYEPFYGLREKPFSLTSDSRFFYQSRSHAPAFDDLLNAIRRRESLNVLTGDIGTGKTTLCRAVLQSLDRKTFSAFVPDPFASREDLLKILLMDFGVASIDDVTSGRLRDASRTELSYLLYEFLGSLAQMQAFAVVFIDEAQNLSVPLLEETRILSDADGQLQVVLVGQLELREKLKLPEMRQLHQRVSVHCQLSPLDLAGVAGYISHRLRQAGGSPDRVKFSGDAVEAIYEMSGGVPRIINRLCDRALRQAYARRAATIDQAIVAAANPSVADESASVVTPAPPAPAPPPAPPAALAPTITSATVVLPPAPIVEPAAAAPAPAPTAPIAPVSGPIAAPPPAPVAPVALAPPEPAFAPPEPALAPPEPAPPEPAGAPAEPLAEAAAMLEPDSAPAPARPDPLEIWRTVGEPELSPVPADWRHRWAPTNAVSPEPEPRSGVLLRIRSASPVVRLFVALAAGFVIVFAALAFGPSLGVSRVWAAIQERITPPPMPRAPQGPRLPMPPPIQPPAPPGPDDPQ